jgi:hypothetical protein
MHFTRDPLANPEPLVPRVLRQLRRADVLVCVVPSLLAAALAAVGIQTPQNRPFCLPRCARAERNERQATLADA